MAFVNRLGTVLPSFGTPQANDALFLLQGTALTAAGTKVITMAGLTPTVSRGYVRVKLSGLAAAQTVTNFFVQLTDGTTTVDIYWNSPTTAPVQAATTQNDVTIPFLVDINATSLVVTITQAGVGAPGIADIELCGTI